MLLHKDFNAIKATKTTDVVAIIKDWQAYDSGSILLAVMESKRRQVVLNEEYQNYLHDFEAQKRATIPEMERQFCETNQVSSYMEFFGKQTQPVETEESLQLRKARIEYGNLLAEKEKKGGTKDLIIGCIFFFVGGAITLATLSSGTGYITFGAIIFGLIRIVSGLSKLNS